MKTSRNTTTTNLDFFAKRLRSINKATNVPFYIFAPNYRDSSGGIRVLHYLCHILNEIGEEAYIVNAHVSSPYLRTPKLTLAQIEQHFIAGLHPASIYPEIIWNNPANTPHIVRWLLNIPGRLGKPIEFEQHDLIYYYDSWCMPKEHNGEQLFIHSVNHTTFHNNDNPDDNQRTLECYYAHKYHMGGKAVLDEHKNLISLGQEIKRTHIEIAAILRKAKVIYCYEPSGIINEALACGCPVLLVRTEYWPLGPDDSHHQIPGLAIFGEPGALSRAQTSLERIRETHRQARDNSWVMTRQMVEAVYRAEAALKTVGKPLINRLQQLWALPIEDRPTHVAELRKHYKNSSIYLADIEANGTDTEQNPVQQEEQYEAYLAACDEKVREISIATRSQNQLIPPKVDIPRTPLPDKLITIIVWTTRSTLHLLANTLDSLTSDSAPCWQLIVASNVEEPLELDGIDRIHWITAEVHEEAKAKIDIKVTELESTWVLELPAGAKFTERLFQQLLAVNHEETKAVFFDDDLYDDQGKRHSPRFKPGVNPEALLSGDLAGPFAVKREAWLSTGGTWRKAEAPWFFKLLKVQDKFGWKSIQHLPNIALSFHQNNRTNTESCLLALVSHLMERQAPIEVLPLNNERWTLHQELPDPPPPVQIFIHSRGDLDLLERCLISIDNFTAYSNKATGVILNTQDIDADINQWAENFSAKSPSNSLVIPQDLDNYPRLINRAVNSSTAEYICFINADTVAIEKNWLEELIRSCSREDVAGASPRLLQPGSGKIESTGNILGLNGLTGSAFLGEPFTANAKHPLDWINANRDITTLTSACFLIKKSVFLSASGMNDEIFSDETAVLDISLKMHEKGNRLLYTPRATLAGNAAPIAPFEKNIENQFLYAKTQQSNIDSFKKAWWPRYASDPYWNRNLSLAQNNMQPETEFIPDWNHGDDNKVKIFAHILGNAQGDYRVSSPLSALRSRGRVSCAIWPRNPRYLTASELARLSPDVNIIQMYVHDHALAALDDWHRSGIKPFTVYAMDDLVTHLDPSNPFFKNFNSNNRARLKYALERCDRMVVSTDFIAHEYRHLHGDIRVVPNRLEMEKWLPLRSLKRTGPKPRIGWAGGSTHQKDLLLLKEVIEQTRDEADWIFFGMCPNEIKPLLAEYHDLVDFTSYPARLASLNFDIAVAPLAEHLFNRGKSNLRLLELGILGIPVVCTDIDPYWSSPACRVGNTVTQWVNALRERIHDADAREAEGLAMKRWVQQNYLLEDHLDEWLCAHLPNS